MRKNLLITGFIFAVFATTSLAQLGSIVWDPGEDADLLAQTAKIVQEIAVLRQTLALTEGTYNQILFNAQYLTNRNAWIYLMSAPSYPTSPNVYGSSGGWIQTLNTGLTATQGWEQATMRMDNPAGMLSGLSSLGNNNFAVHAATLEINASTAQNAMAVTGSVRGNLMSQQSALTALQRSSFSEDPNSNSEVQVLNTVSAAALIQAQSQQDSNQLLTVMTDQQTITNKVRHDVLVEEINIGIASQAAADATVQSLWNGTSTAIGTRF